LVREQIADHDRFQDWRRRWQELKEKEADMKLEQVKTASGANEKKHQKKLQRRSRKRSSGKSSG
jgi:hypothetical protein